MNFMKYNDHFMYIKNLQQIRHCYKWKKCTKIFKNMEECNRYEKTCDESVILFQVENIVNLNLFLIEL